MFPKHLYKNLLEVHVGEDGEGLYRSIRKLALAAGKVVVKLIPVPHHLGTIMAEKRSLMPLVFVVRPKQWLCYTPQETALNQPELQLSLSEVGNDVGVVVLVEDALPN